MAGKRPAPRLPILSEQQMNAQQRALVDAMRAGPRGKIEVRGPFAAFIHAPVFGNLAQSLGAHCRYKTSLSPRQSETAILVTANLWKAQYEWIAHEPQALKAGVKPETVTIIAEIE